MILYFVLFLVFASSNLLSCWELFSYSYSSSFYASGVIFLYSYDDPSGPGLEGSKATTRLGVVRRLSTNCGGQD